MDRSLIVLSSIRIHSSAEKIWHILTTPDYIKQYLFGTTVVTDWRIGSPILFQGEYQGHHYTDKGFVKENKPMNELTYSYWSSFSTLVDKEENYSLVSYILEQCGANETTLTWRQEGFASLDGKCHAEESLKAILQKIKNLSEEL